MTNIIDYSNDLYLDIFIKDQKKLVEDNLNLTSDMPELVECFDSGQLIETKEEKKENICKGRSSKYEISLIDLYLFDRQKVSFNIYKCQHIEKIIPHYSYSDKVNDILLIKTPFITVTKKFLTTNKKIWNQSIKNNSMCLDTDQLSEVLVDKLVEYDMTLNQFIKKKYQHEIAITNLISNKDKFQTYDANKSADMNFIRCKINMSKDIKEISKFINYNVSKKYPKNEVYDLTTTDLNSLHQVFLRVMSEKKEIRFLLAPTSWCNVNSRIGGSYLQIYGMEVKYQNARINSLLELREHIIMPVIKEIAI
jgi:hypothetical protein